MPEFRPFPKGKTRTIMDFNGLLSDLASGQAVILCVPIAILRIIRNLLRDRGLWRTTYVTGYTELGYYVPTEDEFKPVEDQISDFLERTNEMNCNDFLNGIIDIARAIREQNACLPSQNLIETGAGVVGSITQPSGDVQPLYGSEEPASVEPGTFPEGYESLEEYQLDKCQVANGIFDGAVQSLRNIAAFGVFNAIAIAGLVVAALVGMIVFPPAAFVLMTALIGVLSVEVTILAVVAQEMEDNREYWICLLYESETVDSLVSVLADAIDAMLALIPGVGTRAFIVKQIIMLLFNVDTLNQLMTKVAHQVYPGADCSSCGSCSLGDWVFDADLEGWALVAQSCNPGADFPSDASATVSWVAADGGSMRLGANLNTPITVSTAGGPLVSEAIPALASVVFTYQNGPNNVFYRLRMVTNVGCYQLNTVESVTALQSEELTFSLAAYEGEILERLQVYAANSSNQSIQLDVLRIEITC